MWKAKEKMEQQIRSKNPSRGGWRERKSPFCAEKFVCLGIKFYIEIYEEGEERRPSFSCSESMYRNLFGDVAERFVSRQFVMINDVFVKLERGRGAIEVWLDCKPVFDLKKRLIFQKQFYIFL
ncbi:hypothetical protein TNCV_3518651 [Trichonephila clavipes]|uniref:Uncharacterized protein n=1 Tax=Trichonephila clavipes TaxID=2585209 RepID=A0A8X6VR81_TRICX|nr:hypothetical protein TNCV_3518651 [Trichonephila clavipes]